MPAASSAPDAALFDLDGTLVDREPLMTEAVARVIESADLPVPEGSAEAYIGRSWNDVYVGFDVAGAVGWSFDEFLAAVHRRANELVADGYPVRVLAGGRQLMARLGDRGVPIAVVTGSVRREVGPALDLAGVAGLVSLVVAADDCSLGKPHPEGYLLAARQLGVDPRRTVVFEDSRAGVEAGRAAGMVVVATEDANAPVGHPAHQDLSAAHWIVPTLLDVTDDMLSF